MLNLDFNDFETESLASNEASTRPTIKTCDIYLINHFYDNFIKVLHVGQYVNCSTKLMCQFSKQFIFPFARVL